MNPNLRRNFYFPGYIFASERLTEILRLTEIFFQLYNYFPL